jgi:hypothetical protein
MALGSPLAARTPELDPLRHLHETCEAAKRQHSSHGRCTSYRRPDAQMSGGTDTPILACSDVRMSRCRDVRMRESLYVQAAGTTRFLFSFSLHSTVPVECVSDGVLNAHRAIRSIDVCRGHTIVAIPRLAARCLVLGAWCFVRGAWGLVLGAWCFVFCASYVEPGAWSLVLGAWFSVPQKPSPDCSAAQIMFMISLARRVRGLAGRRRAWHLHWRADGQVAGRRSTGFAAERRRMAILEDPSASAPAF